MNPLMDPVAWMVLASVLPAVGFPVLYAFFPWRRYPATRAAMTLALVIAFVLPLSAVRALGGDVPEWLRFLTWGGIMIGLWAQFLTLVRANVKRRADNRGDRDGADTRSS